MQRDSLGSVQSVLIGIVLPEAPHVGGEQHLRSAQLLSLLSLRQVPLSFDGVCVKPIMHRVHKIVLVDVDSAVQLVEMSVGSPSIHR